MIKEIAASTDLAGVGGKGGFSSFHDFYGPFSIPRAEHIGWRGSIDRFVADAQENGYLVDCIHGRMGPGGGNFFDQHVVVPFANQLIESTPYLVASQNGLRSFLVHAPELDTRENLQAVRDGWKDSPYPIWIENHSKGKEELEKAIKLVSFLAHNDVPVNLMIDHAHLLGPENLMDKEKFHYAWKTILLPALERLQTLRKKWADQGFKRPIQIGSHLPIGTYPADSMPIDSWMSDEMLREFAMLTDGHVRVVIEHQHGGEGRLIPLQSAKDIQKAQKRFGIIYDRLGNTGVIAVP